jgi:translation elongation factor EF-Ts
MAITTEDIKKLREATGAGILDCRTALQNSDNDFDKAMDYLREKGWQLPANVLTASPPKALWNFTTMAVDGLA